MKLQLAKRERAPSRMHRYHNAFGWLLDDELRLIRYALEDYIKLGPDSSWPIKLARDLLKGVTTR